MNIYAKILMAIYLVSLGGVLAKFGEKREGKYDWGNIIAGILAMSLLYLAST